MSAAERARQAVLVVFVTAVCLVTAGCSQVYSTSGQLAQAASDASSQAQTAALTLRLSVDHRVPTPASDTALSNAIEKLAQDDSSLTNADVSGALETARKRILSKVRTGEDLLARARQLKAGSASSAASAAVAQQLQATAKQLSAWQRRLQGPA